MLLDVTAYDARDFFEEKAISGGEGRGIVAVDVDLARDAAVRVDGDYDLRSGFDRAGEIAGISGDVIDDDGLAGGDRGTADALRHRYAHVRRRSADKGAEDQRVRVGGIEHVEASPTAI